MYMMAHYLYLFVLYYQMKGRMSLRKCKRHSEPITRICLREQCICDGLLCEKCITQNHKHAKNCKISRQQEPLSYFSINTNKQKYLDYFDSAIYSICQIWEKGNQIINDQLVRLQQTFLLQLNLICKTFALDSAQEIQNSLKYQSEQEDVPNIQTNIKIIKALYKNRENIHNLDEIKVNTEQICKKVSESLKVTFVTLNKNFEKLNQILKNSDIFKMQKLQKVQRVQKLQKLQKLQKSLTPTATLQEQRPKQLPKQTKQKEIIKRQQDQYSQQEKLILHKNNLSQFEKQSTISNKKMVRIKQIKNPQTIIQSFLNNSYNIQYLVIQCPILATQNNLVLLLMSLHNLKALVLNCQNQVRKCSPNLIHYKNGQQQPLDRLEYLYDFKRDLELLDLNKFFIKSKIGKNQIKDQNHYKLKNRLNFDTNTLGTKQTFQLVKRLKLKNIWLPFLSRSQFEFGIESYDFSNIEQITLGNYGKEYSSIPFSLEQKFKTINNLKCFVLIKTSHFILSLSNLFKRLNKLEVLVFEQIKYQGDEKHCQNFFNSLSKFCPEIRKMSITSLENVSIDFISQMPKLQTLLLTKSKKLSFNTKCSLNIRHLNLFGADWNYFLLLSSLKPHCINDLNIGLSNISPTSILTILQDYTSITSLCLDKIIFNNDLTKVIQKNQQTLTNLSLAGCQTQNSLSIIDALRKCGNLKHIDISKCDIEIQFIKNYPPQLQYIVISRFSLIDQHFVLKMFTEDITIIQTP